MFEIRGRINTIQGTKLVVAGEEIHDVVSIHFEHEVGKTPYIKIVQQVRGENGHILLEDGKVKTQVVEW